MHEYRVVLNQLGAAIELHNHGGDPVTLLLLSPTRLEYWRDKQAGSNPNMRHANIGQVAMFAAKSLVNQPDLVSPHVWSYDASTGQYLKY